ncbi:riboflavin biosynthesis protein RibF [Lactobacillus terrae]|uniref:riboflavin biosynthesis protein RibF n=1 Tax=Lactobacillus terrae TaxID=2269374 RepID=UPI000C1B70C9|nr:riboflavin biosynthesis protein RibF [Lactobacillus terrae]
MKIYYVSYPIKKNERPQKDTVLIMGFFDGIHKGHQEVIQKGVELAQKNNLESVLITFDRSPRVVYQNEKNYTYLSTMRRKSELIKELGVDDVYFLEFSDELAHLSPQDFVNQYMIDMNAKFVVAGFDYTYGKKDIANMNLLPKYSKGNFEVISVPRLDNKDRKIGSSEIRELLKNNKVTEANDLLGYAYQNQGVVVHGLKRGREMGFPTANIKPTADQLIPGVGVYVTRVFIKGKWYEAMTSVGYNVTFEEETGLTIESNILNFHDDIYDEPIRIEWLKYLRGEVKFNSMDELIDQLHQDQKDTEEYFK